MNGSTPMQMRVMYEHGFGIARIMEETGKSYETVYNRLRDAATNLVTGGPHDVEHCSHDHSLALLHENGRCPHPVTSRPYTQKERRALGLIV